MLGVQLLLVLATVWVGSRAQSPCNYDYCWSQIGQFNITQPAFMKLTPFQLAGSEPTTSLFVTSFTGSPFSYGKVFFIEDVTTIYNQNSWSLVQPTQLPDHFEWPNFIWPIPEEVFGETNTMSVCDGFLVPGKSTGGIYKIGAVNGAWQDKVEIGHSKLNNFYHNITWIDLDEDGDLDILTARAYVDIFHVGHGELLWLENTGWQGHLFLCFDIKSPDLPWNEHVITDGPDVLITVLNTMCDSSHYLQVVGNEFFSQKLVLYFLYKSNLTVASSQVLDASIGPPYMSRWLDLDQDGTNELLACNHDDNSSVSAIYVYQPTAPIAPGSTWNRTKIASGFVISEPGNNQGTPGFVYPFFPSTQHDPSERPHILVAGDGSQQVYLLRPQATRFTYSMEQIVKTEGMVGALEIGDVDGDGFVEFFAPVYDTNKMLVYSFKPASDQ